MGGKSKSVTVGYKHYLGEHMVLCHGPIDSISRIQVDERTAWQGESTGGSIVVDAEDLFGGESREGGVSGTVDIAMGGPAQGQNSYLVSVLGSDVPAYRGVVSAILRKCYLGNNPYLKKWNFRGTRIHVRQDGDAQWYDSKAEVSAAAAQFAGPWEYQLMPYHADPGHNNLEIPTTGWDNSASLPFGNDIWLYPPTTSVIWIRKTVTDVPSDLTIQARADNGCLLWVNGEYIGGSNVDNANIDNNQNNPVEFVVPAAGTYEIVVKAFTESSSTGQAGNVLDITLANLRSDAMNPAHIIRECLTDPDWGMGYQDADIDDESFMAAADTLYDEGLGMSLLWDRQIQIDAFVQEIVRHIDAALYVDRKTGKFVLKLIRDDYDTADLITLDESNIAKVANPSRSAFGELINSVTVNYWDTVTGKDASITVQDTALVQMQGQVLGTTMQYPGFTNGRVAGIVAARDLRALSHPFLSCTLYADSTAKDLNIGDVFKFSWGRWQISEMVMRVVSIAFADGKSKQVRITCTQDVYSTPTAAVHVPSPGGWVDPSSPPSPFDTSIAFEAPYLEMVQALGQAEVDSALSGKGDIGYVMGAAPRPAGAINGRLWTDAGAGYSDVGGFDFCPYAELDEDIGKLVTEFAITDMRDLDQVEIGTWCQIGEELMRVDAIDDVAGTMTVGRGVLDTVPQVHTAGAAIFFWDEFSGFDPTEYVEGEEIDVKLQPVSGAGVVSLSSITPDTVTITGRPFRPYPPGDFKVAGDSYPEGPLAGTVPLSWVDRDRTQQTSGELYDHFDAGIGPEAGVTYRFEGYLNADLVATVDPVTSGYEWAAPNGFVTAKVFAVRDGIDSWQAVEHTWLHGGFYPYVPAFQNLGFETGDTTGWESYVGPLPTVAANDGTMIGNYYAIFASSSSGNAWGQTVDLAEDFWEDIDAGRLRMDVIVRDNGYDPDSDGYALAMEFLDASGNWIGGRSPTIRDPDIYNSGASDRTWSALVTPLARKVRLKFYGNRNAGTELSVYLDNIRPSITEEVTTVSQMLSNRGDDAATWTTISGVALVYSTFDSAGSGAPMGRWNMHGYSPHIAASAEHEKRFDFTGDALTAIAAGRAAVQASFLCINDNNDDRVRVALEFYDASNTLLKTAQTAAATTDYEDTGQFFDWPGIKVPPTCTYVKARFQWTRVDGTYLDASVQRFNVHLFYVDDIAPDGTPTSTKWRIRNLATASVFDRNAFSLIEMRTAPGGANACVGGTASQRTTLDGNTATYGAAVALDGNTATIASSGLNDWDWWWQYEFASAVNIAEVAITGRPSANGSEPALFLLEYFDGSAWVPHDWFASEGTWGVSEQRVFTVG